MISILTKGCQWVLQPSRSLFVLMSVGVSVLFAPTAQALEVCDPDTTCVYVYSTIDERQFAPLFIAVLLIAGVQLITLILATTKPLDAWRKRRK